MKSADRPAKGTFTILVAFLAVFAAAIAAGLLVYNNEQVVFVAPDPPQLQMQHIEEP